MPPKNDGPTMTQVTTEEEWQRISGDTAERDVLFMVEVYAAWCGPSEAITSTFKKLYTDFAGRKIKFMQEANVQF